MNDSSENAEPTWVGDVIRFWFEELGPAHWFTRNAAIDAQIRNRFLALHERLVAHDGLGVDSPRAILAAVVVFDQLSRNMFRDDARAYSTDFIARRFSRTAIDRRCDSAMKREERYFLYLPFEHSEDAADQSFAVSLIKDLGDESWMRYAMEHKKIIDCFGRFPHRNAALHRQSTAAEIAFLSHSTTRF